MRKSGKERTRRQKRKLPGRVWAGWPTERLLDLRMCDLDVSIPGTVLEKRIDQVRRELERRNLRFQPYYWFSDDWFTPEDVTGTAIPFYLAHPRLMRLERGQMGEVEGGTHEWCMKLLRHEVGHALDHAFLLHRRRRWQKLFGRSSYHYPRCYRPNPYSRRHVHHLEYWYAQSHPDEDFAETFAVWLRPNSHWRSKYRGWPALRKLEYVDELMAEIAGETPLVRTRSFVEPLSSLKKTLREHYARKMEMYPTEYPSSYDHDLQVLFSTKMMGKRRESASAFIRRHRPRILRMVSAGIGEHRYQLEHVLREMTGRCRELRLYAGGAERETMVRFAVLLTKHTMESLYRHRYWVEM